MATTIFATGQSKQGWGTCSDMVETTKTHTHISNIFDVVSTRTTAANPTINKQRTGNGEEDIHNGWRNC